jgi:hypothetical protein
MKMKSFSILLIFSLLTLSFQNKPQNNKPLAVLFAENITCFTIDHLGNTYIATSENDIIKFDKEGNKTATSNYKSLGNIRSIDATNPFEVYVFYKEQNKVLYFDNLLNYRGTSDFEAAGYFMLSAVARSFDNKVWVFDLNDLRLKKVRKDLSLELSSGNVREFSDGKNFDPDYIVDINQSVFVFERSKGLFEFDIFGNYTRRISMDSVSQVFCASGMIFFLKNNKIYSLDQTFLKEKLIDMDLPDKIDAFAVSRQRMVIQSGKELLLYPLKSK